MDDLTDNDVREVLRDHRDGGVISRLYATGEITQETIPTLGVLSTELDERGEHETAERVADVITYADAVGERPPVKGWTSKV
ncbi:hypothetical protein [Streptomyces sp. NRRL S-920]|uniref:hypothetical protein n=1 Tax=Streptomyces sp. NRRL S-920 TaxID=1463921 RepID=UPI0004C594FE|nr:hypothetical protein [Streptomyces sp. NRRL S-920]